VAFFVATTCDGQGQLELPVLEHKAAVYQLFGETYLHSQFIAAKPWLRQLAADDCRLARHKLSVLPQQYS
jgi:hypothetical protein